MREKTWRNWNDEPECMELLCIAGPWDGEAYGMCPHERTVIPNDWLEGHYEVMRNGDGFALVWQRGRFWIDYADKRSGTDA
jgi:hypothetical protein